MSERMTSCRPVGQLGGGIAEYGRLPRVDMIRKFREHYQRQLDEARKMLGLEDDELVVETYRGVHVQKDRVEVR